MQGTNEQMDKMTNSLVQACADINSMMRDSVNAVLQSATIVTKGCTDLCDNMSTIVQKTLEQSAKAGQEMMGAKSVHDMLDTQTNLLKSNFETLMNDMGKLSQLSAKVAQDAAQPVADSVNDTINKISKTKVA